MNNVELAVQFFFQLAIILMACRVVGFLAVRLGQPQVVAEMITGVLLGPSLLGWMAPDLQSWIFPWDRMQGTRDTQSYLFPASQLGLALYMFVVGMEFRVDVVASRFRSAVAVSLAGMFAPFVLGAGLAWILFHSTELFPERTSVFEAMLFLGASMCITAFPMLARILHHKKLTGTTMGTVALGAGAIDDAAAWCLLAVVLASFDANLSHALWSVAGGSAYVALVILVVKPIVWRVKSRAVKNEQLTDAGLAAALTLMAMGAWFTESIGLHAVFGAFIMGTAMPRGIVARDLLARIQPLTVVLFLPLFFTYSGLNTQMSLLNSARMWLICLAILVAAIMGKGVACAVAARATGLGTRDAIGIGVLMNARGLMELIIINIGLQRGIISPELFASLVIMAVVTTLMTSPIFEHLVGTPQTQQSPSA